MEIVLYVLLFGLVTELLRMIFNSFKTRLVYVIEDNESDIQLFKLNVELDGCAVKYYRNVEQARKDLIFNLKKPDAVIVDYHLDTKIKGTDLVKLCRINRIPSLLVTGDEREILGVGQDAILRKTADKEYFSRLTDWINLKIA